MFSRIRRAGSVSFAAVALVAIVVLAACGGSNGDGDAAAEGDAAAPRDVRFTVFPGAIPSLGVYIADAFGYFEDEGLNVSYVNVGTGSSAIQVLLGGDTDFTISDVTGVALARRASDARAVFAAGQFHRFMASLQCRPGVVEGSGSYPAVMSELEGKRVGITAPGSSTDTYFRYSMQDAGADPAAAEFLAVGGVPNLVSAVRAGRLDCLVSYQPIQSLLGGDVEDVVNWAEGEGPAIFGEYLFNGIVASGAFAEQNPEVVEAVSRAMEKAVEFGADPANAEEIAERTAGFFEGIETADLAEVVRETAPTFGYHLTPAAVENALRVFNTINPNETVDYEYDEFVAEPVRDALAGG
jgi:NitT/TauT family transport system substrate-binding protein